MFTWRPLGNLWHVLGRSGSVLGTSETRWDVLGAFGSLQDALGRSGEAFGRPPGRSGTLWEPSGCFWKQRAQSAQN